MIGRWCVAAAAVIGVMVAGGPTATAEVDFYRPPPLLPGAAGDVIRTEPMSLVWQAGAFPAAATRIMYRSNDTHGSANAVTGTFFDPALPWTGPGPRPLVSMAAGTQGQGDQCAPSKTIGTVLQVASPSNVIASYEVLFVNALLSRGIAVVLTDYEGLGTPGLHTYVNRAAEAHAVLDAARAAKRLPGTGITPDGPVAFWGYSQGGGAAAAAVELQPEYAPELDVRGAFAGAPPADLAATLEQVDGRVLAGAIGYTLNGIAQAYPEARSMIEAELNDRGRQMLSDVQNMCVGETRARYGFQRSESFTKTGEPLSAVLARYPLASRLFADQKVGDRTPQAPVLIVSGINDDTVPYEQARRLAQDWCGRGATVRFSENALPRINSGTGINHAGPYPLGAPEALAWITDRFAGLPAPSSCGEL
ncbi:alpha/beta fold hydrolase [Prescottella agglutinans]|uniref:Alpha/beta fold hydrolase n=1 Tax=Prescottella agglutinans TaxID=1644129 RepID=A0A3S3BC44_9NOCA|nr:alpha/beta fold hydrolase [Prescottella agglutinans]RVW07877.1 alpha/beta fold hydrolase [Prescottella agglutinans]